MKLFMDYPPQKILEKIIGNLGAIADWYIEESFSYIRVFDWCIYILMIFPDSYQIDWFTEKYHTKQFWEG